MVRMRRRPVGGTVDAAARPVGAVLPQVVLGDGDGPGLAGRVVQADVEAAGPVVVVDGVADRVGLALGILAEGGDGVAVAERTLRDVGAVGAAGGPV